MKRILLLLVVAVLLPVSLPAEAIIYSKQGLIVWATSGAVKAIDESTRSERWSIPGVETPTAIAISSDGGRIVVLDALHDRGAVIDVASARINRLTLPETPIAAVFLGHDVFVMSRDAGKLTRVDAEGRQSSVSLGPDPSILIANQQRLFVYSRLEGTIQAYDRNLALQQESRVGAFASDLEVDAIHGYLVFPRSGKVAIFSLESLRKIDELAVGAVPVDLALEGAPNAVTAGLLNVADPSSKQIWKVERTQTSSQAFGRGFMRGLLGLGLYSPTSTEFPTGVDRVSLTGRTRLAYDTAARSLYLIRRGKGVRLATDVPPLGFAVTPTRVVIIRDDRLEFHPVP